ncbi:RluA family pseudouridine synthase [Gloeobacter kilaueensis]|uniref:Pseudouridine synthase n=1 Tax=Gloeobacter kilaueensis (strain ATCC BAA-2537 / CCAP 1431/1 / ULC 316 / JS1) TaxID=1183438 RepID=U5QED8_GLOK1|nr:RluA family pseudouridine synthase [Gloeobacter kilaueensis]AGY57291.1 ribosomal large subunit pseudouridine synthase D [Gloeobacter kilaueensis JS1]
MAESSDSAVNQGCTYIDRIDRVAAGATVLDFYRERYRHSQPQQWRERIEKGEVLLDGKRTGTGEILRPGQVLSYHRQPWQEPPVPLHFEILYEDEVVLVVAKPSGLPVLPGGGFVENTLLAQLKKHFPERTPVPVHRLGRGTSGLLLLARTPKSRAALSEQLRRQQITKIYRALASGSPVADHFAIDQPIGKVPYPGLGYLWAATDGGLTAYSECSVLRRQARDSLLAVTIRTGRPHQIRIHLAAAGHPLVGDPLYGPGGVPQAVEGEGRRAVPGDCGYWLHAWKLGFRHPESGRGLELTCAPPPGLA